MFSVEEEQEIERVNCKHAEIALAIKSLSLSLSELEEICKTKEKYIENYFDQLIFKLKTRKITLLDEFKKISSIKKKLLLQQLQQIKMNQKELNDFKVKYEQMILGESHGIAHTKVERKKYILSTTKKLLNNNYDSHPIVNPIIKIENFDASNAFENIQYLGRINPCNIPYPPNVAIKEVYASSAKIQFEDIPMADTPKATEYKIEILHKDHSNKNNVKGSDDYKNGIINIPKWETGMIVDNGDNECMLRGLVPHSSYLIRVCGWNKHGWSCYSKSLYIKTKHLSRIGQRMIYLAPTPAYQNKLSILMTSYFTKWKGFHITIGGRHRAGEISSSEIAQELSELGEKLSKKQLWQIPNGKWKVLGGKDLIVLGLDDSISIFKVASKFLLSKGWKNVKTKNFHITLGLKKDLKREQIKEMAHILVDKEDPIKWEWVSVKERPDGKIVWDQRFPAYHL